MSTAIAHPYSLVDTAWVEANLSDPQVKLVQVDEYLDAYEAWHLPGAANWDWTSHLNDTVTRNMLNKDGFQRLMSECGITRRTRVVLYGDNNNWFAAYAFWLMTMYGHGRVSLMDGGSARWAAEGKPRSNEPPAATRLRPYRARTPDLTQRATSYYVLDALREKSRIGIVDVRSPEEYSGDVIAPAHLEQEGAQRGGHIPGAVSVPWDMATDSTDGTIKSAPELSDLYGSMGITADAETIVYCRIGERAAHTWFVLSQVLGYPKVRNYDGSWVEWGSMVGVPIER
ncbi:MAG: sulfurtransferase [SAR202 cluster bacterium]|nr:sulfurtransferase [Chloroflexota bacterium]MDP6421207.1 sulfurtransferase [SAR202 cluster bacterium]HAL47446.1 sulfurtransferase [Dehalococcoidia bacterium]MDP6665323.1 sulfurtransferase [SAR202 cluster bacterium]MDP6799624.1 sulfurtransferase [SAR202 cluster bacterium]